MIGDEFKTARLHLLEHLDGCIAWKDPKQAQLQKERIRQKRELAEIKAQATEQSEQPVPFSCPEQEQQEDEQEFVMSM